MTEYLMAVHNVEGQPERADAEMQEAYRDTGIFNDELQAEGVWVYAGGLHPANIATVVNAKDGEVVTTDGPFAESKEQLGGFWVIKADDLDQALAFAARASKACREPVEVRPFQGI